MNDQELFDYITQRKSVLREATAANTYRPTGAEDSADALLWDAIKYFGSALYNKAKLAREKYGFRPFDWAYPDWQGELQQGIVEHLQKGDPRDVAIYAMFAHFHGWSTAAALSTASSGDAPLVDAELAELVAALEHVAQMDKIHQREMTSGSADRWCGADSAARAKAYNALPGLLTRLAAAEAHSATLQGALESSAETSRVLASRLKMATDALPTLLHYLNLAEEEADKEGENDGYEALYNAASHVGGGLRKLLHELNGGTPPTSYPNPTPSYAS